MKIILLSRLRGSLNMPSTCQHCRGPCKMHFCIIFVIFAFQGVHSSHFSCYFSDHFWDHSEHSSAKHMKMSQKWLPWTTLLSRGATEVGTLITQPFHSQKITEGASGALRQEFRELELLNEITDLLCNGKLHKTVTGEQRNMLITFFRLWKESHYVPHAVHKAIRWNSKDPLLEPEIMSS